MQPQQQNFHANFGIHAIQSNFFSLISCHSLLSVHSLLATISDWKPQFNKHLSFLVHSSILFNFIQSYFIKFHSFDLWTCPNAVLAWLVCLVWLLIGWIAVISINELNFFNSVISIRKWNQIKQQTNKLSRQARIS